MNWLFWQKDSQNQCVAEIQQLAKQLVEINNKIEEIDERSVVSLQQTEEVRGQLAKQTRIQYKSSQEIQAKLEDFSHDRVQIEHLKTQCSAKEATVSGLTKNREALLNVLLQQLDEFDRISAGLKEDPHTEWQSLLAQWIQRILATLADNDVYDINILGQSFDPQLADGVGAIARPVGIVTAIPYEVVEIVRRGFVDGQGVLLRKAQVITYQEGQQ